MTGWTDAHQLVLDTAVKIAQGELSSSHATVFNLDTQATVEKAVELLDAVKNLSTDASHPLEALAQEAPDEPPSLREAFRGVARAVAAKVEAYASS